MKKFTKLWAALVFFAGPAVGAVNVAHADLLADGQSVVATFNSGRLKGQTFKLLYNKKSNILGDRPVTKHTDTSLEIKTPGGWCKFASGGLAKCHNGKGVWKVQ